MDAALELRVGSEELVRLLHALRSPTPSQQQRLLLSQVRVWERPALEEAARLLCGWPGPLRVLWVPQEESDERSPTDWLNRNSIWVEGPFAFTHTTQDVRNGYHTGR